MEEKKDLIKMLSRFFYENKVHYEEALDAMMTLTFTSLFMHGVEKKEVFEMIDSFYESNKDVLDKQKSLYEEMKKNPQLKKDMEHLAEFLYENKIF